MSDFSLEVFIAVCLGLIAVILWWQSWHDKRQPVIYDANAAVDGLFQHANAQMEEAAGVRTPGQGAFYDVMNGNPYKRWSDW